MSNLPALKRFYAKEHVASAEIWFCTKYIGWPKLLCSAKMVFIDSSYREKLHAKDTSFPKRIITSVQGKKKKKRGQFLVSNSSECPDTIAQLASDQAHHLLTLISWCQTQYLIHPTAY